MNLHRRWHSPDRRHGFRSPTVTEGNAPTRLTLLDVPLGCRAKIGDPSSFGSSSTSESNPSLPGLEQLQAYGLASGYWVRVLQRTPVIVLQIDHLELAMEKSLAAQVIVEEISQSPND
jgi:hypothetical protein